MLELSQLLEILLRSSKHHSDDAQRYAASYKMTLPVVTREIIQKYSNVATPGSRASYKAALKFLNGELERDSRLYDLLAFALHKPINELSDKSIVSDGKKLGSILDVYRQSIKDKKFRKIVWYGILQAYFQFDSVNDASEKIRVFLESTFDKVYELHKNKPLWMIAIKNNKQLLSNNPCSRYAKKWHDGDDEDIKRIKLEISIPDNSWFWNELVISCIKEIVKLDDDGFISNLPRLLDFIESQPSYLDYGLYAVLERYRKCDYAALNTILKDFAVKHWKSPRLRHVGGSKWLQVAEPVWKMILGWVNEANLRLFFSMIESNGVADKNRLDFWLRYINQISWTKLILGADTYQSLKRNSEMAKLFENETDSFSSLNGDSSLDAFIMKIGDYMIVEFSTEGGCYVYKEGENTFDPNSEVLSACTAKGGLKERWKIRRSPDIVHRQDWQPKAEAYLMKLSIYPDVEEQCGRQNKKVISSNLTNNELNISQSSRFVANSKKDKRDFEAACLSAKKLADSCGIRTENTVHQNGHFWVYLKSELGPIAKNLKSFDFQYMNQRGWWIKWAG